MNGRRGALGLCMLCALLVCAVAAQGAAATTGTTAFTCNEKKEPGGVGFSKGHCRAEDAVGTGAKYEHVAVAQNTTTEISGSNKTTEGGTETFKLKYTMAGIVFSFNATGVTVTGSLENQLDASGEHYIQGQVSLKFTGVTSSVTGCKVYADLGGETGEAGVIQTETLSLTTKGQGDKVKIEPLAGEVLARYWQKECKVESLNGTDTVRGVLTGTPNGSTLKFTHAETTTQGLGGTPGTSGGGGGGGGPGSSTGIEGTLTIQARDPLIGGEFKAISPTTVET